MSADHDPDSKETPRSSIPRRVVPIYWAAGLLFVHAIIPWAISLLTPRYGWTDGRPGVYNFYALVLVSIGLAIIIWTMALHFARAAERVEFERTPRYLLTHGPYRFSRNPMYLGELVLWLGWVFFFGSLSVLIAFLLLVVLLNFRVVPREERELEARFGDSYVRYKKQVPRWVGVPQIRVQEE